MCRLAVSIVVGLCAAALAASAAATPDKGLACGSVITESTTLTRNMRDCDLGLEVQGSNITLDLGGRTIAGTGASGSVGVRITGDEVTVLNGKITGFETGVTTVGVQPAPASGPLTYHLRWLKVVRNGTGVATNGPVLSSPPPVTSTIERTEIERNTGAGVVASFYRLAISDSSIRGNDGVGVALFEAPTRLERNDISRNGSTGVRAIDRPVTMIGNRLNANGEHGLSLVHHPLDPLNQSFLQDNVANRNSGLGIYAAALGSLPWEGFDGGGNVARNNGDERECVVESLGIGDPPLPPEALTCVRRDVDV